MKQYKVIDEWSDKDELEFALNDMARQGYQIDQVLQGYISELGGAKPAIIMSREAPAALTSDSLVWSVDDQVSLTQEGLKALALSQ